MTSLSDILFPSQEAGTGASSINRILGDLKRSNLSITNRLRSVQQDAHFVEEVAAALGGARPLVANERCGSWYIRPECKGGSAYFKSTDGHTGQWNFSTRRLNLHLLPLIERCDGIIIVDSTRRGKRMPDALSKTIPIWCCVLNRALFPDRPEFHDLYVPPNAVSDSEKSQMLSRIPDGLEAFTRLKPDLASLRAQISRPIRPAWVTQETDLGQYYHHHHHHHHHHDGQEGVGPDRGSDPDGSRGIFQDFRPVVCCTSSRRIADGEMSGHAGYIQGAGDDTENWAHGLTPPVFWASAERLLSTPEAQLPGLIASLVATAGQAPPPGGDTSSGAVDQLPPTARQLTPHIFVCPLPLPLPQDLPGDADWCTIALPSSATPPETWPQSPSHMEVGLGRHKAASRNLRLALANICGFVTRFLSEPVTDSEPDQDPGLPGGTAQQRQEQSPKQKRILVACETGGRDLSVGVALALLCWCFEDDEGVTVRKSHDVTADSVTFNKTGIKIRLGRIMTGMPEANPNRATLQSVNSFLMDWRK